MWKKFEDWWYFGDHEKMERNMSKPGIIKNAIVIRSFRAFIALIMIIDLLFFMKGLEILKYISIWAYLGSLIANLIGTCQYPGKAMTPAANKYSLFLPWKWHYQLVNILMPVNFVCTIYFWTFLSFEITDLNAIHMELIHTLPFFGIFIDYLLF